VLLLPPSYVQGQEPSNRHRGHTSRAYHSRTTLSRSSSLQRSYVARTKKPERAAGTASLRALGRTLAQVYGRSTAVFVRPNQYLGGCVEDRKLTVSGYCTGLRKLTSIDLRMKEMPRARRKASAWTGPPSSSPMEHIQRIRLDSKKRTASALSVGDGIYDTQGSIRTISNIIDVSVKGKE
jgi:hypothetical protein